VVYVPTRTAQEPGSNVVGLLSTAAQLLGTLITIIVVSRR
jgi:hypothetical protein